MSRSLYLNDVLPRLATRTSINSSSAKTRQQIRVRPRDHVTGDQLPDAACGFGAGIDRRANAPDIAADDRRHVSAADLDRLDDFHVGGLAHRVSRFDQAHPALGLNQAER